MALPLPEPETQAGVMAAAAARRIQTTVLRASTTAARRSPIALPLLWSSPHKVCKGLSQPTYLRLQKSPVCASPASENDVTTRKVTANVVELRKVLKGSPTEGLVDSLSLKEIELRTLKLEVAYNFYKDFGWMLLCPIFGILISIPSAISTVHGLSTIKENQKEIDDEISNLKRRLAFLDSKVLDLKKKDYPTMGTA